MKFHPGIKSAHVLVFLAEAILKFFGLGSDLFQILEGVDICLTFVAVITNLGWYFVPENDPNYGKDPLAFFNLLYPQIQKNYERFIAIALFFMRPKTVNKSNHFTYFNLRHTYRNFHIYTFKSARARGSVIQSIVIEAFLSLSLL